MYGLWKGMKVVEPGRRPLNVLTILSCKLRIVGAASLPIGECDPNQNPNSEDFQPGGNRWPVGNFADANQTGQVSPYRWKSLFNENVHGTGIGTALTYIRYDNEFVGTVFDDQNTLPNMVIDAFGLTGTTSDPLDGNTSTPGCSYAGIPLDGQNYMGQSEIDRYYNGCFGDYNIYFPRPSSNDDITSSKIEERDSRIVVHPNPANNRLTVSSFGFSKITSTNLYESGTGKPLSNYILSSSNNHCELDLSRLSNGIYTLKVELGTGKTENHKVVVIH